MWGKIICLLGFHKWNEYICCRCKKINVKKIALPDKKGWLPLHYAAVNEEEDHIRRLVASGADVNATTMDGASALTLVAMTGKCEMVTTLIQLGANPNCVEKNGMSPLHFAAKNGHINVIEKLYSEGANLNICGLQSSTPLHWATNFRRKSVVKWFLEHGADPDPVDALGWTPLFLAFDNNDDDLVEAFVQEGAEQERIINDHKRILNNKHVKVIPIASQELMMIEMTRRKVGGVVRFLDITFMDGRKIRCKCKNEKYVIIPNEYEEKDMQKMGIPYDQTSPED